MKKQWILKNLLLTFLAILAGCFTAGCHWDYERHGNGNIISQQRNLAGFEGVILEGVGNVNIHISPNFKVIVTTDSNLQDIIITKVRNNKLYIDEKGHWGFRSTKLTIDVYMPDLTNIRLEGVGDIKIGDGQCSDMEIRLSGVGDIDAKKYKVENMTVNLSGTGDINTWATNKLEGRLSGVGDIRYKGSPTVNVKKTGIGKIKPLF